MDIIFFASTLFIIISTSITKIRANEENSSKYTLLDPDCKVENIGGNKRNNMYGRWQFCTNGFQHNMNVFSIGIGTDITFDVEMVRKYHSNIWAFDPTISNISFHSLVDNFSLPKHLNDKFKFYPFGLGNTDTVIPFYRSTNKAFASRVSTPGLEGYTSTPEFYAPVLSIQTLQFMTKMNEVHILKIDVEGAEFDIFSISSPMSSWLKESHVSQISIEHHARFGLQNNQRNFKAISELMRKCGFTKRYKSPSHEVLYVRTSKPTDKC